MEDIQLIDNNFLNKSLAYIKREEPFTIMIQGSWVEKSRKNFPKFLEFLDTLENMENLKGLDKVKRKALFLKQSYIMFSPLFLWSTLLIAHNDDMHFDLQDLGDAIKIEVKPID